MCGICKKINDKYILTYNIFEKKYLDNNLKIKYKIPTPNDIVKNPNTILTIVKIEQIVIMFFILKMTNILFFI